MITVNQDITKVEKGIILQICNIAGGYGKGVAHAIASTYPKVKIEYKKLYKAGGLKLGTIQRIHVSDKVTVINMFAMPDYRRREQDTNCYLDYNALAECLQRVNSYNYPTCIFEDSPIYIPYLMGCGNAGGDWKRVEDYIRYFLDFNNEVIICKYEPIKT